MDGTIEFSKEGMIRLWEDVKAWSIKTYERVITYFKGLDLYQIIAWSAIGLGLILVIVSIVLFLI